MLNKLSYYLLVIVAIIIAACSDVEEILTPAPDQSRIMSFNIGNQTKVSNADITSQEFIIYDYIYGAEGYTDGTCYIDGSKVTLKYRDGRWDFYSNNGDTRVDFLWTETGEHRFYAFNKVEYQVSMAKYQNTFVFNDGNPYILFGTNVNTKNEVKDVVYSTDIRNVDNSSEPYSPINLKFSHFFSSIKIEVKNVSGEAQNITNFEFEGFHSLSNEFAKVYFNGGSNLSFDKNKGSYSSSGVRLENGQSWFPLGVNPIMVWPQSFSTGHNPFFEFKSNDNDKFLLFTDIGVAPWQSGKLHHITLNLAPDPVRLYPEVKITHVMNDDGTTPKYSDVSISLNPTGDKFNRLQNLQITVLAENGTPTGLEYSSATVNSNDIVISGQDKSLALTPGQSFVVKFEYNDTYNDYSDQVTVESPAVVLPTVDPDLGYYVNNDGTFSETFVEGKSIAKIFWMGNPTNTDQKLKEKFPVCNRGLAYKVNGSGGPEFVSGKLASSLNGVSPSNFDTDITKTDAIRGYSNTLGIISRISDQTFKDILNNCETSAANGTSPWYIPSFNEFTLILNSGVSMPMGQMRAWTSTLYSYYGNLYAGVYYNKNITYPQSSSSIYLSLFILAF